MQEEGENIPKIDKLLHQRQWLAAQLKDLSFKIEKLENNHFSRWHSGNLYLSFLPQLTHFKRKLTLEPPPQAKLFSTSDTLSPATSHLDFRNRRIVPLEVLRNLEKTKPKNNRKHGEKARQTKSESKITQNHE